MPRALGASTRPADIRTLAILCNEQGVPHRPPLTSNLGVGEREREIERRQGGDPHWSLPAGWCVVADPVFPCVFDFRNMSLTGFILIFAIRQAWDSLF